MAEGGMRPIAVMKVNPARNGPSGQPGQPGSGPVLVEVTGPPGPLGDRRHAQNGLGAAIVAEQGDGGVDGLHDEPGVVQQPTQAAADAGVANHVAGDEAGEGPAGRDVGGVDGQGVPVRLGQRDATSASKHPPQLGHGRRRIVHVLQHPVDAGPVDARRPERQCVRVTGQNLDARLRAGSPPGHFTHPGVPVHADHSAVRPGRRDHGGKVGAGPAAHIEHDVPRPDPQLPQQPPLVPPPDITRGGLVKVGDLARHSSRPTHRRSQPQPVAAMVWLLCRFGEDRSQPHS
nr:hypothetical protein GCM10020092_047180 [Actinoplanes digitatis]